MKKKDSKLFIPVSEPYLKGNELKYATTAIKDGWISSSGRFLEEFEEKWAAYCGRKFGVAVSNGTTALQVAVAALDLKPGSEIILPSFTIISCMTAILHNNCVPVLVDIDPATGCMDVEEVARKITKRTKAIMPVHIYGHPVDMDEVMRLARAHKLTVIEDAAEAHGAEYLSGRTSKKASWKRCGSFGEVSCFSFYANKLLTTGEGGMVLTDDAAIDARLRSLRNLAFGKNRRFLHESLGFNYRMTNVQAALGLAQLENFKDIVARKKRLGEKYCEALEPIRECILLKEYPWARSVWWMFGFILSEKAGMDAAEFSRKLREHGVETRPFFLGMHEQPVLKKLGLFKGESYPVTERFAKQGLYLPSGTGLKDSQMRHVVDSIKKVLR